MRYYCVCTADLCQLNRYDELHYTCSDLLRDLARPDRLLEPFSCLSVIVVLWPTTNYRVFMLFHIGNLITMPRAASRFERAAIVTAISCIRRRVNIWRSSGGQKQSRQRAAAG